MEEVLGVIGGHMEYNDITERIEGPARNKNYLLYVDTTSASFRVIDPQWREKASIDPNQLRSLMRLFSDELPSGSKKYLCFVKISVNMDRQVYIYHFR